jgi:hypothetical protein
MDPAVAAGVGRKARRQAHQHMGARVSGRPGASVAFFQNNFMGEALFLCSHKRTGRGKAKKVVFLSQPCMKLPIKLFYQTIFFKQLSFIERLLVKLF